LNYKNCNFPFSNFTHQSFHFSLTKTQAMTAKTRTQSISLILAVIALSLSSCAPVFSELQSARTLGQGNIEATPSFSTVSFSHEGESEGVQNHIGLQLAYGITPGIDLRFRYEHIWFKDSDADQTYNVIGLGPKFSLLENNIAFYVPVGRAVGEYTSDTWQMHPTMLFTYPALNNKLDITFASKYLIAFCEDCENLVALNLGLAISEDVTRWAVRPEFGMLFNPGESGHFWHLSLGFTYGISR
jgi:hypothetical protein